MKYAKRFDKDIECDEYYRFSKLTNEKNKIEKISHKKILDLGVGDPNTCPPNKVIDEVICKIKDDNTHGYSDNGLLEFRYKVSNYLGVEYNKVTHTMGTKEALCILALLYLNPNDYLLITNPGYHVIANMAKWLNTKVYYLPLKEENNFELDLDKIPKYIYRRTKLMCLNYPNNPTSKLASKELYLKAIEKAKKYKFMIINDNAYGDLVFDDKNLINFRDMPGFYDVGIELNSFSKGYNMTGYRIGYILSNKNVIRAFQNVKDNLDSGQYIPIQYGAMKAIDCFEYVNENKKKYLDRQIRLHELLTQYGFNYELPKGTFFAYVRIPKYIDDIYMSSAYKCSMYLLKKYGIMSIPYDEYNGYLRFSLIFKEDEEVFFNELKNRLDEMKIVF